MGYDESYREHPALFGEEPEPMLVEHYAALDPLRPVLDVGSGQGRHALYLARRGLEVQALDPSAVAVETVRRIAAKEKLPVEPVHGSFDAFEPVRAPYSGVLLFGLIQILTWEGIARLQRCVAEWMSPGSLLFLTAFGVEDAGHAKLRGATPSLGRNSYRTADGEPRTYLEPGEVLKLFADLSVVHHWEGLGPEHHHGDGVLERHDRVEAVLRA